MVLRSDIAHLVLGGSRGIGFAYARHYARKGHSFTLVARDAERLDAGRLELLSIGASSVEVVSGDLIDPSFRQQLMSLTFPSNYRTVLIGGPSPPAGGLDSLSMDAWDLAQRVCLDYPFSILDWISRGRRKNCLVVLLSSAATMQRLCNNPFYASALLRRALESHARCLSAAGSFRIKILRPHVVSTDLAENWIIAKEGANIRWDSSDMLAREFGVARVPTADEYIDWVLSIEEGEPWLS